MRFTKILVATALPLVLSLACGGSASDSGDGDGDSVTSGDGDSDSDSDSGDGDGDSDGDGEGDEKDEVCETFCNELEACEGVIVEECVDSCTDNETTSVAGQEVITECFDAALCEEASEEALALGLICLVTEASDLDLSEEAETYCDESVDIINECLGSEPVTDPALGNCDDTVGLASDDLLADLNACAERPCDEVESCLTITALGAFPIEEILELQGGGEPSPALVAEILAVAVVFGQLGLEDATGDLFGDLMNPEPTEMGGSSGR